MRRRVVITGIGCATPLGQSPEGVWRQLVEGHSGVREISLFDASDYPVRIAAEVPDWNDSNLDRLPPGSARQTAFALSAALQAFEHAGLQPGTGDPLRLGVYLGCGEIYPDFQRFANAVARSMDAGQLDHDRLFDVFQQDRDLANQCGQEPAAPVGLIAAQLDAQGPCINYTTACVSSSIAIGEAAELIRRGTTDVMLTGGAHSMIHPFGLTGFLGLSTLTTQAGDPTRAYRPFDRERDGFVVGEGGVVFVLEDAERAKQRGAQIWAEVTGYGATQDAFRICDPRPDGASAARAIQLALDQAEIGAQDVDYINAHGSGTVLNDRVETAAVKSAFGDCAYQVPISSTKSMTGHLTTACGAIEMLVCAMAVHAGVAPPTINYEHPDPECDLDYTPNTAREIKCRYALNNNFGFGGHNVSLVVSRFEN